MQGFDRLETAGTCVSKPRRQSQGRPVKVQYCKAVVILARTARKRRAVLDLKDWARMGEIYAWCWVPVMKMP